MTNLKQTICVLVVAALAATAAESESSAADSGEIAFRFLNRAERATNKVVVRGSNIRAVRIYATFEKSLNAARERDSQAAKVGEKRSGKKNDGTSRTEVSRRSVFGTISVQSNAYRDFSKELGKLQEKGLDRGAEKFVKDAVKETDGYVEDLNDLYRAGLKGGRKKMYAKTLKGYERLSKELSKFEKQLQQDLAALTESLNKKYDFEKLIGAPREIQLSSKQEAELKKSGGAELSTEQAAELDRAFERAKELLGQSGGKKK